jgi:Polyketide cyclase / dehydrase and lipid transport
VASNDYHFVTSWRIAATPAEISDVLADAPALARWWPSVYLEIREVAPGDDDSGLGKVVELWTKGFLPYTLRWRFTVTESRPPTGFRLEATGDFVGRGIWTLAAMRGASDADGPLTIVTYDWLIVAEKGILKRLSPVMKPIFKANHHWAMARGEESLKLELARRHAAGDPTLEAAIPAPPGPTFPHNLRAVRSRRR